MNEVNPLYVVPAECMKIRRVLVVISLSFVVTGFYPISDQKLGVYVIAQPASPIP